MGDDEQTTTPKMHEVLEGAPDDLCERCGIARKHAGNPESCGDGYGQPGCLLNVAKDAAPEGEADALAEDPGTVPELPPELRPLAGSEAPPWMPIEHAYNNTTTHFVPRVKRDGSNGGMIVVFTPCVVQGDSVNLMPPQIRVGFSPEGWETFKKEVAKDGERSKIVHARDLPPELGGRGVILQ